MADSSTTTPVGEPTSTSQRHAMLHLLASPLAAIPTDRRIDVQPEEPSLCSAASNTSTTASSLSRFASDEIHNASPTSSHKCSLSFILASADSGFADTCADLPLQRLSAIASFSDLYQSLNTPASSSAHALSLDALVSPNERAKVKRRRAAPSARNISSSRKSGVGADNAPAGATKTLVLDGAVKKGSKYCVVDGCGSRAKHARRCWKHGGSVKCKVPDCVNRAKTKGVCWSHGGGTICSFAHCGTISVSNGVCWAHGGGKRCVTDGCSRPAYERTANLCSLHFENQHGAGSVAALKSKRRVE